MKRDIPAIIRQAIHQITVPTYGICTCCGSSGTHSKEAFTGSDAKDSRKYGYGNYIWLFGQGIKEKPVEFPKNRDGVRISDQDQGFLISMSWVDEDVCDRVWGVQEKPATPMRDSSGRFTSVKDLQF